MSFDLHSSKSEEFCITPRPGQLLVIFFFYLCYTTETLSQILKQRNVSFYLNVENNPESITSSLNILKKKKLSQGMENATFLLRVRASFLPKHKL